MLRDHFRQGFQQLQSILDEILPPKTPEYKRRQLNFSIMGQCLLYRGMAKIIPLVVDEDELKLHYGIEELADHITQTSLAMQESGPSLATSVQKDAGRERKLRGANAVAKTG